MTKVLTAKVLPAVVLLSTGTQEPGTMKLESIKDSWELRVRDLDPKHVAALLVSIRDQGLLEPLVVDQDDVLIAGNHRYAAIVQLKESAAESAADAKLFRRWFPGSQVPVNRLPFKAREHVQEAIAASVAENQRRQQLDPQSVKAYKDKLVEKFGLRAGRPRKGETAIMPMLVTAFQRSAKYISKTIRKAEGKGQSKPPPKEPVSAALSPELYLPKGVTAAAFAKMKPLERAKRIFLALRLSDAEMQHIQKWCGLSRSKRNDTVAKVALPTEKPTAPERRPEPAKAVAEVKREAKQEAKAEAKLEATEA